MVNAWIGGVGAPPTQPDFSTEMVYDSMCSKRALLITTLSSEVLSLYNSLTYCVIFFIINVFILNFYIAGSLMESPPDSQSLKLVLAAPSIKSINSQDVSLCIVLYKFQSFGGSSFLHLHYKGVSVLKLRAIDFFVMLVLACQTTWCQITEDHNISA